MSLGLAVVMTWPQAAHLGTRVKDRGDPLLNTWIMAWDARKLSAVELSDLFDANIFYPQKRTLAYSENLLPQAVAALPVRLAGGSPVLAYNVVFLLAFATSALAMAAFARTMTGSDLGAAVAGIAFAFSPFMFSHLAHVQVLAAGGIPLTFLFLERFFRTRRWRDAAGVAAAMAVQMLANGYYALFLALFVPVVAAAHLLDAEVRRDRRVWIRLGAAAGLVAAVTAPVMLQYVLVQREMGLDRGIGYAARLASYLATPRENILYGALTERFAQPERELFPGLAVLVLAGVGAAALVQRWRRPRTDAPDRRRSGWVLAVDALMIATAVLAAVVLLTGPVRLGPLRASSGARPMTTLVLLAVVRLALTIRSRSRATGRTVVDPWAIYAAVGVLAFLFTFGDDGPYPVLYRYLPGFDGIRAIGRFNVITSMVLALLAALGVARLAAGSRSRRRLALLSLAPAVVLLEFASVPIRQERVPVGDEIPPVYRFVAEHGGPGEAVLELPLPAPGKPVWVVECPRVYLSTSHWKPLVNGFSGFFPPLYDELRERWATRPAADNLRDLQALHVGWVVVHTDEPGGSGLAAALRRCPDLAMSVRRMAAAEVFRVRDVGGSAGAAGGPAAVPLRRDGWKVSASVDGRHAGATLDGRIRTRWTSGPQRPGVWFQVELPRPRRVGGVRMALGSSWRDYPRGWVVSTSMDGRTWHAAASGTTGALPIESLVDPRTLAVDLTFDPVEARIVRIALTDEDPVIHWSIHEIGLLGADRGAGEGASPTG